MGIFIKKWGKDNMIDTIKIYTEISKDVSDIIYNNSVVKQAIDNNNNHLIYEITNDSLVGSYDSRLSVRIGSGVKYCFCSKAGGYFIEIEGSYHKWSLGYNSHNGFCDLEFICNSLISNVEAIYDIELPALDFWYLQRVDIAICFDLKNNNNVKSYINSLSRCDYPRRNTKFFTDESLYLTGTTTTLKIYNKLLEFKKHDQKKFIDTDFNLENYKKKIDGFVRFECEVKKKKLVDLYNDKNISVSKVFYDDLKKVWSDEFMKLLKFTKNELEIVRGREAVYQRLQEKYSQKLVNVLFNFYCSIQLNGIRDVKNYMSSSTFYRNLNYLKSAGIDVSQSYKITELEYYSFDPFTSKEVA